LRHFAALCRRIFTPALLIATTRYAADDAAMPVADIFTLPFSPLSPRHFAASRCYYAFFAFSPAATLDCAMR